MDKLMRPSDEVPETESEKSLRDAREPVTMDEVRRRRGIKERLAEEHDQ